MALRAFGAGLETGWSAAHSLKRFAPVLVKASVRMIWRGPSRLETPF